MSTKLRYAIVWLKYEFIKAHRQEFATDVICRDPGVAPTGNYAWLQCPQSARAIEDARLLQLIQASHTASHGIYGAPRVLLDFREAGETRCTPDARARASCATWLSDATLGREPDRRTHIQRA